MKLQLYPLILFIIILFDIALLLAISPFLLAKLTDQQNIVIRRPHTYLQHKTKSYQLFLTSKNNQPIIIFKQKKYSYQQFIAELQQMKLPTTTTVFYLYADDRIRIANYLEVLLYLEKNDYQCIINASKT